MVAFFSTRRDFLQCSLRLYYCCTHGTRHGYHGCLILVRTSSLSPMRKKNWTCSWTPDNCGCCPVLQHRCVSVGPCTLPSTMRIAALHDCCPAGCPAGWSAGIIFGQADIRDHHLFGFQLVASYYTDCPLRYTRLSSIAKKKDTASVIYKFIKNQSPG